MSSYNPRSQLKGDKNVVGQGHQLIDSSQVHGFSVTLSIHPLDHDYVYKAEQGVLVVEKYHDNHGFQVEAGSRIKKKITGLCCIGTCGPAGELCMMNK